jgi:hypothetical protein
MRPIERSEILPLGEYERVREHFRGRVIADKRRRRLAIGEHLSVLFENRDSVMLQIQEMLRTERITSEPGILHEIETYNDLLPAPGQLSLTLFVQIPDRELRERFLRDLVGLEESLALEVGGKKVMATGKRQGAEADRTTAVHYLKFDVPAEMAAALKAGAEAFLAVEHPRYRERSAVPADVRAEILGDLSSS